MDILKSLSYNGVKESYSDNLNRKIIISNRLTMLLFVLALFYTITAIWNGIPLWKVTVSGLPLCVLIFTLNYFHKNHIARILAAILPILIACVYHAASMQNSIEIPTSERNPITASYIIGTSFIIVPFILFDLEEKAELILSVILCTIILMSVRIIDPHINIDFDSEYARTEKYEYIIIALTAGLITIMLLVLLQTNKFTEAANQKLVNQFKDQNENLKQSQIELKNYVAQAEANKQKDIERSWEASMLSEFTDLLSGQNDLQVISDNVLSKVIKSLKANQGAIYLFNESDNHNNGFLQGISCYAHDRKRFFEKEILIGEGVVGQSFMEQESIYITDIPSNYFEITSGLGKSYPKALLAVPLIANEEAIGIIEIASFHNIEDYQKQFIEKLGENIAITFYNIRNNKRTEELLKEVQKLNKDYQKQEKELQLKIEKLQNDKEEIERREKSHLEKIKKLEDMFGK